MIASDILTASLRGTLDDVGAAKWTDAELLAFLSDGVRWIQVNHPASRQRAGGGMAAVLVGVYNAPGDAIDLDPMYQEPLREYVLWRAFSADKGDAADARRAAEHENALRAWFMSPAGMRGRG